MKTYTLEVKGPFACFTRPEMKVERVSYDVITPSAARAIFEAILWKPVIRWHVRKVEVLAPIRWISVRRNEVGAVVPVASARSTMRRGSGNLALYVEEERQQRAGLFLRDVAYRLHADLEVLPEAGANNSAAKFWEMFERRVRKGQCINQPYLGCREFACEFRFAPEGESTAAIPETRDLGWMLFDLDFTNALDPAPRFFRAVLHEGVLEIPDGTSPEVRQ